MTELLYTPASPPQDPSGIPLYVHRELIKIGAFMRASSRVVTYYEEPPNSQDGDLAIADGVGWNPGSGTGFYIKLAGAWSFVV
jgi:hypothetical protein